MNKKKARTLVLIGIVHLIACIFSGAIGWDMQTAITSIMSVAAIIYCYKKLNAGIISFLPVLPFFLLYIPLSIDSANPLNYPVWVCGIIVSVLGFLSLYYKIRTAVIIPFFLLLSLTEYFYVYPNYFSFKTAELNPGKYNFSNSKIVDINNAEINFEKLKGKVLLFDIWHSACLPCIEQFPEIERLYEYYKSDSSVKIISLNFPLKKDKGVRPTKFTDPYSFEKMYFFDEKEYEKFSMIPVPLILIMDKNMKCRYAGTLNLEWNIFIGNAKRIISKLKKENE